MGKKLTYQVAMLVEREAIGSRKETVPACYPKESILHRQYSPVTLTYPGDITDDLVGFIVKASDRWLADWAAIRLVDEAIDLDYRTVFRLRDELSECTDVIECTLGIRGAHYA